MATIKKWHGVTLSLYLDGTGGECSIDMYCENNSEKAHRCPHALGEISPLPDGEMCMMKRDGRCYRYHAQLDALKRAKSVISARLKEVEAEIDGAN